MTQKLRGIILFVLIITAMILIPRAYADLPPPIEWTQTESGGLYNIATNVSMPEAEVNISIQLRESWKYTVNVSCEFVIHSSTQQNLTTAFVYPALWEGYFTSTNEEVTMNHFEIAVNGTSVDFSILDFDEFKEVYNLNQTEWHSVQNCFFAIFNFSVNSDADTIIDVVAEFSSESSAHDFSFEYIVDTARGWDGNTHETVQLQFERTTESEIIEYRYWPDSHLVSSESNYSASLFWDFFIQDFEYERVIFLVQQREYPPYNHALPPPNYEFIVLIGISVFVILGILIILKYRTRLS